MADEVLFGPISFLAVGTTSMTPEDRIAVRQELKKLRDSGTIRLLDAVYAQRDQFGAVKTVAASDLTKDDQVKLGVVIGGLMGLGASGGSVVGLAEGAVAGAVLADEAKKGQGILGLGMLRDSVRDMVPEGAGVLVLLVEHLWAKNLKQTLFNAGGVRLANFFVTPEMFVEAGIKMAILAQLAEDLENSQITE